MYVLHARAASCGLGCCTASAAAAAVTAHSMCPTYGRSRRGAYLRSSRQPAMVAPQMMRSQKAPA